MAGAMPFTLATTLLDRSRYPAQAPTVLCHRRWAIEEMHEINKEGLKVTQFHARGERTVEQKVYAACTLSALTRLVTNRCDDCFRSVPGESPC